VVVFSSKVCQVFKRSTVYVRGVVVHSEARDPQTGFYPFTMRTSHPDSSNDPTTGNRGGTKGVMEKVRQVYCTLVEWACAVNQTGRFQKQNSKNKEDVSRAEKLRKEFTSNSSNTPENKVGSVRACVAKFYRRPGVSDYTFWHEKLGHVGAKVLRKCQIKNLSIPRTPFRCESCVKGKMHQLGHSTKATGVESVYLPGEHIHTDLQGPYVRDNKGHRYSQLFIDVASRRIWTVRLGKKTESDEAIRKVLQKSKILNGRPCKFLKTDGDGIFGDQKGFRSCSNS
jgi:hypothetical protein